MLAGEDLFKVIVWLLILITELFQLGVTHELVGSLIYTSIIFSEKYEAVGAIILLHKNRESYILCFLTILF